MIIEVLFVVVMLLWALSSVPNGPGAQWPWAGNWLGFIAVLLLGLELFVPALR